MATLNKHKISMSHALDLVVLASCTVPLHARTLDSILLYSILLYSMFECVCVCVCEDV